MALQLVYTSAPRLLDAGRTGFGIVARSKSLPPLAANAIERFSKYANMQGTDRSRVVMAHRKVTIGSNRFHVLSRICDSGSDHTGRTNHIAHHLIFSPLEIRQALAQRLTPADIFAQFAWLDRWEGTPKVYDGSEGFQIEGFLPEYSATNRAAWIGVTGEPIHSRLLAWDEAPRSGALIVPAGIDLLPLLGEALAECQNPWGKTFTTSLEPTDELSELDWVIASPTDGSAISRVSSRMVYDVSRPIDLPVPPEAALPEPDAPATTVPITQKRQVPLPDLKPHLDQTPRESREASVATRGAGNGKLWLIMGGGFAALFLLIAMVLVLVKMREEHPPTAEAAKEEEKANLIKQLVREGESEGHAENIAECKADPPVLEALPDNMLRLKASLTALGKKKSTEKELENFIAKNKDIEHLDIFPAGSLCESLWESLSLIRQLHREDDPKGPRKRARELLGELKLALENGSRLTESGWLQKGEIDQIYLILWEWKYQSLVENLLNDASSAVTKSDLKNFMTARDVTLVSDTRVKEIYQRCDEDKLNKWVREVKAENPELLAELLLPSPPVTENEDKMAGTNPDKASKNPAPMPKPPSPGLPTLEDEKWCWSDFEESNFKEVDKVFSITLPNSKILKKIAKTKDPETAEFSFGDEENIKVTTGFYNANKMIKFDDTGSEITCDRDSQSVDIPSPLKILYQGSKLVIHLGKWPEEKPRQELEQLSGKLPRNPPEKGRAATYTLVLKGDGIKKMQTRISKTIPGEFGVWLVTKEGDFASEDTLKSSEDTLKFKLPAGSGDSPLSKQAETSLRNALKITEKHAQKELEKKDGGNKLQQRDESETQKIHRDAWTAYGKKFLQKNEEAKKWLEKNHGRGWSSVSQITGDKDQNSEKLAEILRDPKGNEVRPKIDTEKPVTLEIKTKTGKNSVFRKDFRVELEKLK